MKKKEIKNSKKVNKRDWNKVWLITLLVLLALEVVLIPLLVYSEVKRILPIVAFLVLPTLCGLVILYLSRNCTVDYENKKTKIERINSKR